MGINTSIKRNPNRIILEDNSVEFEKLDSELQSTISTHGEDIFNLNENYDYIEEEIYSPLYTKITKQEPVFNIVDTYMKCQTLINAEGLSAFNLVENGNFNGTSNWITVGSGFAWSVSSGEATITNLGTSANGYKLYNQFKGNIIVGNKYYLSENMLSNSNTKGCSFNSSGVFHSGSGKYERLSHIWTADTTNVTIRALQTTDTGDVSSSPIKIKNVMCINLTAIFGAGNEPTKEECDKMFANHFNGIGSVNGANIRSVGKNIFKLPLSTNDFDYNYLNRCKVYKSGEFTVIEGLTSNIAFINSKLIRVKKNTDYVLAINGYKENNTSGTIDILNEFDVETAGIISVSFAISTVDTITTKSFNSGNNNYIRIRFYPTNGSSTNSKIFIRNIQLEENSYTEYEPYIESIVPLPNMRSLPNGVKDEIINGRLVKRVGEYILQASDIATLSTSNVNNDIVGILKKLDYKNYNVTGNSLPLSQSILVNSFVGGVYTDTLDSVGKNYNLDGTRVGLIVSKSTYADLATAKTALTGTKILYELAQPIVEDLVNSLIIYPNGMISIESSTETTIPKLTLECPINVASVLEKINEGINQNSKLINTKVDKKHTEWISATLQNGWTGDLYYRINQIGQLEIKFYIYSGTITAGTAITTLPIEYRPIEIVVIPVYQASDGKTGQFLTLTNTGLLHVPAVGSGLETPKGYKGQIICR